MLTLECVNLEKSFGDRLLFTMEQPLKLYQGDRLGIVGVNGAGKTTLLHLLAGILEPDAGTIRRHGTVAVVAQWEPEDGDYSGGEETRRRLAAAFGVQADILFADEPTSHLDLNGILDVERILTAYPGTVVLISHDRELLDAVCTQILEIENGKLNLFTGNYSKYIDFKQNARDRAWLEFEKYTAKKAQLTAAITEKKQRASRVVKAPRGLGSSEARMGKDFFASKAARMEKNAKAIQSRIEKLELVEKPRELPAVHFDIQAYVPIHGKAAIRLERLTRIVPARGTAIKDAKLNDWSPHVVSSSDNSRTLFRDLSLMIRPGAKVALLGSNGSGKSTLLSMIADRSDGIRLAGSARVGYFHQKLKILDDTATILDNVMSTSIHPESTVRTVLARLLFKQEEVFKRVELLSGGERVKTALAKLFLSDCNLLLLDEPTNYLDLPAKEELEKVLLSYPGTILFATHDRRLAAQLADQVLSLDGERHVWFDGTYEAYTQALAAQTAKTIAKAQASNSGSEVPYRRLTVFNEEELLRLELERNTVLARLSIPQKHDNIAELDQRFKTLSAQIISLHQLREE
ncbi:ABC-F family ATP-binding cassette domain-containing protein [Paenibacillus agricola]|uniref:ABC-F family ATP-binding cassette domain-containing protein n=1 Tax=Paenibacillus agricola TaxID=2716264 RepID=A0ABX0JIZ9_9BACL|nr:ABC-F family ATP-binding cassette domain-containing protein [Paenibacillus agricola]NHN35311.1 ABC-F family ATP-binding cassette domain-containing protein [Paenibacillus agricola]